MMDSVIVTHKKSNSLIEHTPKTVLQGLGKSYQEKYEDSYQARILMVFMIQD